MNIKEMVWVALEGVWANKLRSGLTMLGIIVGVQAVIIIVMLGLGFEKVTTEEYERMGLNSFTLMPKMNDNGVSGKISIEECDYLKNSVGSIDVVVPVKTVSPVALSTPRKKSSATLIGTNQDQVKITSLEMSEGRFFNSAENQMGKRSAIIDTEMAEDLFGKGVKALGKDVSINKINFEICGVYKPEESISFSTSKVVYVPVTTMHLFSNTDELEQVIIRMSNGVPLQTVKDKIIQLLEIRQGVEGGFQMLSNESLTEQWNSQIIMMTGVFGAVAGIALIVGGIGIMNTILISVTQRTREIGIRIAIGANRRNILSQFLVESIVITTIGGLIGMVIGMGGGAAICGLLKLPIVFSLKIVIQTVLFSTAIGIIFGILPARRASKMNPIDTLRYE